jgi:hypothetical protein
MRFPAVQIPQPKRPSQAADFVRRLVTPPPLPQERNDPAKRQDLPVDLDQRVRLIGEW